MRWEHNGASADVELAVKLIKRVRAIQTNTALRERLDTHRAATQRLLRRRDIWSAIEIMADALRQRHRLSMDDANDLLERSEVRPVTISYWS
jgi:hypothetical protein